MAKHDFSIADPLEAAHFLTGLIECDPFYSPETHPHARSVLTVAYAYIRQMTPVEITLLPGAVRGVCQCQDTPEYGARYCEDCGRPIKWMSQPSTDSDS